MIIIIVAVVIIIIIITIIAVTINVVGNSEASLGITKSSSKAYGLQGVMCGLLILPIPKAPTQLVYLYHAGTTYSGPCLSYTKHISAAWFEVLA